jgi:hypothetical protein
VPQAIDPLRPPSDLIALEPERSDVSLLGETHTADTAPATLPEPLVDESATSAPAPPSDVFLRSSEPVPHELELPLAPLDTPAVPDSAPRSAPLGARPRPRRGPYWEWALLGFSGTLLLVAMALRHRGLPLFSAGLERPAPVVITAPLRPHPHAAPPLVELTPEPVPVPTPPSPAASPTPPTRKALPRKRPRVPKAAATARSAPAPVPQRVPARDSVRAGLAQELP